MIICYEFFGKINHQFKTTMGEECAKILNTLGKKEMGALESYIKSGGADAVGKRVLESVMEKASKATPLTPSKTLNPNTSKKLPLLPSQPLNPSPKNTPLHSSPQHRKKHKRAYNNISATKK